MHSASSIPSGPIMSALNVSGVVNVVSPHSAGMVNSVPINFDPLIMFPSSSIIILHTVIDPFFGMVVVVDEVVEVDVVLVLVVGIVVVGVIVVDVVLVVHLIVVVVHGIVVVVSSVFILFNTISVLCCLS